MRLSRRLALPGLMVAAALVFVWPLALNPLGVPFAPGSEFTDLLLTHLPNAEYARRMLWEHGQWPLWNGQLLAGQPFAADPLAGLWYPPAWLLLVPGLNQVLVFNALLVAHLAWGGLGAYRLLAAEGVARGPALLGGLAWAGTPKVVAHLGAGHAGLVMALAWTPWLLAAARAAVVLGGVGRGALAGAALALTFLADVRWAAYAGALSVAYAAWTWLAQRRSVPAPTAGARLRAVGSAAVFAGLLCAVLALPLAEFIQHSRRTTLTLEEAALYSLPPVAMLTVVLRHPGSFHELTTYVGTVTLLLAALGLRQRTLFWIGSLVLAALFALGGYFVLFPVLFDLVPGLSLLRVPSRAWFVVALALCMLAGHGAHRLTETWWPALTERYARVKVRLPAASTALIIMMVAGALDLARFNGSVLEARPAAPSPAAAAWLRAQPGLFRVYSPSYSLPAGDELQHADGVDPLQLATTVAFLEKATGVTARGYSVTVPAYDDGRPAEANRNAVPDAERLGLLNVRYVAAEYPLSTPGLRLIERFGATHLYENEHWRPRAWVEGGSVEAIMWSPNAVSVTATGPGQLVLSEIAYPGWQARVDGQAVPIETVHEVLRTVQVPAGTHQVEFVYRPLRVFAGVALTALGLAGFVIVLWRERPTW